MSNVNERRQRLMNLQTTGRGSSNFKRIIDLPEDIKFLKLKPEETVTVDIIPFPVGPEHKLYKEIKADAEEYGEAPVWWTFDYAVHKAVPGMEQVVCPEYMGKGSCPICEEKRRIQAELGCEWGDDRLKPYNFSKRAAYLVCEVDGEDDSYKILDHSQFHLHNKLTEKADTENIFFLDETIAGSSVQITAMEETYRGNTFAGKCMIKFVPRKYGYTAEDLGDAFNVGEFFNIDSSEKIYEIFHALAPSSESTEKEEEEIIPASTPTTTEAPSVRQPATNSRRGRGRGTSEAPVVEEGTTVTVTEAPRRGRGRGAVAQASSDNDEITF